MRNDILGGLRLALSRGQSLENAMQSFYNSGYTKEDIEEAARALKEGGLQPSVQLQIISQQTPQIKPSQQQTIYNYPTQSQQPTQFSQPILRIPPKFSQPSQPTQKPQMAAPPQKPQNILQPIPASRPSTAPIPPPAQIQKQPANPKQIVSNYGSVDQKKGTDWIAIILISILVVLLGILVAVFFYKQELLKILGKFLE